MEKINKEKDWNNLINCSNGNIQVSNFKPNFINYFRKAFGNFAKNVLKEQKKVKRSNGNTGNAYYDSFQQTNNGETIINPNFKLENGKLLIDAEIGFYESYHAFNGLKNGFGDEKMDFRNQVNYKVLSAGVVMFDKKSHSFYLFKRPNTSQEAPGQIDILGGCMNTKDGVIDGEIFPELYVASRMKTKAGLNINPSKLNFLGVQEFKERGFYNLVYIYYLNDDEVSILEEKGNLSKISGKQIDLDKNQDNPGGAGLSLSLEYLKKNKE